MDPENEPTNPVEGADEHVQTPAEVETSDQHQPELHDNQDPDNPDNPGDLTAEELAEIEYEGQKYKVPPALKDAVLRQSDYTRKTQELAEQRRAVESRQAEITQAAEAQQAFLKDYARASQLEERISQFESQKDASLKFIAENRALAEQLRNTDWEQWAAINPAQAEREKQLFDAYEEARAFVNDYQVNSALLQRDYATVKSEIEAKQRERISEAQREHAKRMEEAHAELARDLKDDWSPEGQRKIMEFGQSMGFSAEELSSITDPRAIKVLHAALKASRQAQTAAARATLAAQQATKPVPQVGGSAPAGKDPSRMSDAEWMRWRNQQLQAQRVR